MTSPGSKIFRLEEASTLTLFALFAVDSRYTFLRLFSSSYIVS
jgi:hypothetical protein